MTIPSFISALTLVKREAWEGVGGRLKREGIYVYLWLIHCCTAETNTTL